MNLHSGGCWRRKEGLSHDISLKFVNLGWCSDAQCSSEAVLRRGLWRKQTLLNIYSEEKLKWRCTEALGTDFASGEEERLGWFMCLQWIFLPPVCLHAFRSCADLEHSGCPEAGSFVVWQRAVQRNSTHHFKPTTHQLRWVIPVGKKSGTSSQACEIRAVVVRCDRPCVYRSTFLEAGWVNVFKIHSPETVAENSSMFVLAKFPGAKLVHVWKTNWSSRTSAEVKPKQSEITVNLCLFELLEKS